MNPPVLGNCSLIESNIPFPVTLLKWLKWLDWFQGYKLNEEIRVSSSSVE